jgi:hypothetical protein
MSTLKWRVIGVLITAITVIASVITIYEFTYFRPPNAETGTQQTFTTQSTPFDFYLSYKVVQGVLCKTSMILNITVSLSEGSPRTVYLTLQNGAIPSIVTSYYFSPAWATPSFNSYLTVQFVSASQLHQSQYYLTVVGDDHDGVVHILVISFTYPLCF